MAKFPQHPDRERLGILGPDKYILRKGEKLWRVYKKGGPHPTRWNGFRRFGPVTSVRFDHHTIPPRVQDRAITYLTTNGTTCIAECFQERGTIDVAKDDPWLVGFLLERDVVLHNLRRKWPTRAGASTLINSGKKDYSRNWSQAIYEEYVDVEGLYYSSSMNAGRPAIALYERAEDALPKTPHFHRSLADLAVRDILKNAARELSYVIVDGRDVIWTPWHKT